MVGAGTAGCGHRCWVDHVLSRKELLLLSNYVKTWSSLPEDGMPSGSERDNVMLSMEATVNKLNYWAASFTEAKGRSEYSSGMKWGHSTQHLFDAIIFSLKLKGGSSRLMEVLSRAITLVAPSVLVGPLQERLQQVAGHILGNREYSQ